MRQDPKTVVCAKNNIAQLWMVLKGKFLRGSEEMQVQYEIIVYLPPQ